MMGKREDRMRNSDEYDALTRKGKRIHRWRAGVRSWIKRRFRRRERRSYSRT